MAENTNLEKGDTRKPPLFWKVHKVWHPIFYEYGCVKCISRFNEHSEEIF
jgi:hypothetical protein